MEIECPHCGTLCQIDGEDLPSDACDNEEYECNHCGHVFEIGWHAEVELRSKALWRRLPK